MSSISNFIKVADSLRIDNENDRFLHVNGTAVSKVNSTHEKSSLLQITNFVRNIITQDLASVSNKEKQRFRHAFSCVIHNYSKDPAYKEAYRLLKTIGSKKVHFQDEVVESDKKKLKRTSKMDLESLHQHPELSVDVTVDCIRQNFFDWKDLGGNYVIKLIRSVIIDALEAVADDPSRDMMDVCWRLIKVEMCDTKDHFTRETFEELHALGWLHNYDLTELNDWPEGEERELLTNLPQPYIDLIEEILCNEHVEKAIRKLEPLSF